MLFISKLFALTVACKYFIVFNDEIKSRSWFVTRADNDIIMECSDDNAEFWKSLIKDMGDGYNHIAEAPIDPTMN